MGLAFENFKKRVLNFCVGVSFDVRIEMVFSGELLFESIALTCSFVYFLLLLLLLILLNYQF